MKDKVEILNTLKAKCIELFEIMEDNIEQIYQAGKIAGREEMNDYIEEEKEQSFIQGSEQGYTQGYQEGYDTGADVYCTSDD